MITYYIKQNDKIVLYDIDKQRLQNTIACNPNYFELPILETENIIQDGVMYTEKEYKAQKAQEEAERIKELSMTRSDFFDATIKAFGADQNDFLPIIENILSQIPDTFQIIEDVSNEVAIKIALNNYTNAQNFYRKHPLFTILTDVPIRISELLTITITSKQWDEFFDETSKNNKDAYKKLISNIEEKINE